MNNLSSGSKMVLALEPASSGIATRTGLAVDGTGFSRVMWFFLAGTNQATGTQDVTITSSATSGGTYAAVDGAVIPQITTANDVAIYAIDMPVNAAKPFMKLSDVVGTAAGIGGAMALLYNGTGQRPVTQPSTVVYL